VDNRFRSHAELGKYSVEAVDCSVDGGLLRRRSVDIAGATSAKAQLAGPWCVFVRVGRREITLR
jgi:hypothetical protein